MMNKSKEVSERRMAIGSQGCISYENGQENEPKPANTLK
jgi:hypothetical protein